MPQLSAAIAYYTIFSLAPLLILVVSVAGFLFDQDAARQALLAQSRSLVGSDGAEFMGNLMENAHREDAGTIATIIGIGAMIFGATGAFVALHEALNRIWGAPALPIHGVLDFMRKRFLSFSLVLATGFLLLVSLVLNTLLVALNDYVSTFLPVGDLFIQVINWVLSFVLITVLFALIFKFLPDVQVRWRDVWPGAAVTTLLFNIGKEAIGLYLGNSAIGSTFGAAGALALLLIWIYYSAQVLLIGAEFTQVYARLRGAPLLPAKPDPSAHQSPAASSTP